MSDQDTKEARLRISAWFPAIGSAGYKITSGIAERYNCIAWAAGDDQQWWEAAEGAGYYWPEGVLDDGSAKALIQLYERLGYEQCGNDGALVAGIEKIAVYADESGYTHASLQLEDGRWASKLGPYEDIEHETAECLCGKSSNEYGIVHCFMMRLRQEKHPRQK